GRHPMSTNEERLLQLIRLDRWLQRRDRRRLWAETTGLATVFACLADLLAMRIAPLTKLVPLTTELAASAGGVLVSVNLRLRAVPIGVAKTSAGGATTSTWRPLFPARSRA